MQNPIRTIRETRNLSRVRLGLLLDCGYDKVFSVEAGYYKNVPPYMLRALERIGEDPEQVARDYATWREQERAEMLADGAA